MLFPSEQRATSNEVSGHKGGIRRPASSASVGKRDTSSTIFLVRPKNKNIRRTKLENRTGQKDMGKTSSKRILMSCYTLSILLLHFICRMTRLELFQFMQIIQRNYVHIAACIIQHQEDTRFWSFCSSNAPRLPDLIIHSSEKEQSNCDVNCFTALNWTNSAFVAITLGISTTARRMAATTAAEPTQAIHYKR